MSLYFSNNGVPFISGGDKNEECAFMNIINNMGNKKGLFPRDTFVQIKGSAWFELQKELEKTRQVKQARVIVNNVKANNRGTVISCDNFGIENMYTVAFESEILVLPEHMLEYYYSTGRKMVIDLEDI